LKNYPLGIAYRIAVACDCIRRGDLDGAASCLAQAARIQREQTCCERHGQPIAAGT